MKFILHKSDVGAVDPELGGILAIPAKAHQRVVRL